MWTGCQWMGIWDLKAHFMRKSSMWCSPWNKLNCQHSIEEENSKEITSVVAALLFFGPCLSLDHIAQGAKHSTLLHLPSPHRPEVMEWHGILSHSYHKGQSTHESLCCPHICFLVSLPGFSFHISRNPHPANFLFGACMSRAFLGQQISLICGHSIVCYCILFPLQATLGSKPRPPEHCCVSGLLAGTKRQTRTGRSLWDVSWSPKASKLFSRISCL